MAPVAPLRVANLHMLRSSVDSTLARTLTASTPHDEGQQGVFKDKVWTAEGNSHVSDRQFVDGQAETEVILPESENAVGQEQGNVQEVIS